MTMSFLEFATIVANRFNLSLAEVRPRLNKYTDGSMAFQSPDFSSLHWDPTAGFGVNCGRGVTGWGSTIEEAEADEQRKYDEAFAEFSR